MPRLTPVPWKVLECIFLLAGFVFKRQKGDHRAYFRPGSPRPVVIPTYARVDVSIINANRRTAGLSRERYFDLLEKCRSAA